LPTANRATRVHTDFSRADDDVDVIAIDRWTMWSNSLIVDEWFALQLSPFFIGALRREAADRFD
jgi:hypothetical protein